MSANIDVERSLLTPAWTRLRYHAKQHAAWNSSARFVVLPCGRRSGKSTLGRRKLVAKGIEFDKSDDGLFLACAPTRDQAHELHWDKLKRLVPPWMIRRIVETDLSIELRHGTRFHVVGLDKPQRVEGVTVDGAIIDEFQEVKPRAWNESLRPSLSTEGREGWAWILGRPRGRNLFHRLYTEAATKKGWAGFSWPSSDILAAEEIEAARNELDELTFQQEYEASFINFEGRAYYSFTREQNTELGLRRFYNPRAPLLLAMDFNVEPGAASLGQEVTHEKLGECTAWFGEVHIPRNSNTPAVCRKVIADWGRHEGDVIVDGDATGGNRGTAKVQGSDWDLVKAELRPVFGDRLKFRVPQANPAERARVNAVNSRMKSASGQVRLLADGKHCPELILDFEGVQVLKGGSGELDKKADGKRTHWSDAVGYYHARRAREAENTMTFTPI